MTTLIPTLCHGASETDAAKWVLEVVQTIGPGFHFDTRPQEYERDGGIRLLEPADADRMSAGLAKANALLGDERFENACLEAVWTAMGFRYDDALGALVPVST